MLNIFYLITIAFYILYILEILHPRVNISFYYAVNISNTIPMKSIEFLFYADNERPATENAVIPIECSGQSQADQVL